ncbi:MAG: hypothetical protein HQL51_02135 [Magnetococcales bacterium]|nr:hypothetical protein [Magnetococcales bacterium]
MTRVAPEMEDLPPMVHRLRRVGRIALLVGMVALIALVGMLLLVASGRGEDYAAVIGNVSLSRRQLGPAMVLTGLIIVALGGVITWSIALYSTLRVAGPLFRFTKDLDRMIADGPLPPAKNREDDDLHKARHELAQAAGALQEHYDQISELTDLAAAQLQLKHPDLGGGLTQTLAALRRKTFTMRL